MTSNRFDLPTALAPAMQVKGPKWRSTPIRFLNPLTRSRVSMEKSLVSQARSHLSPRRDDDNRFSGNRQATYGFRIAVRLRLRLNARRTIPIGQDEQDFQD